MASQTPPDATPSPESPAKKPSRTPLELQAMARIDRILKPFKADAKKRILDWNHANVMAEIYDVNNAQAGESVVA